MNPPQVEFSASRQLTSWMAEEKVSFAFTTYQTGKLFLVGTHPDGRLSVFERTFNRCMGLTATRQALIMSTLYQVWRFENILEEGQESDGYDRVFVPKVAYTTGDLDIHDIAVGGNGKIFFANTLFSCLSTISPRYSFIPVWRPPFVSRLAAEDRCHLNGLAMDAKLMPRYMTAVAASDVADGWREQRGNGGLVLDVRKNETVAADLSMPHSPRIQQGKLWLLNSGTGFFGQVDLKQGRFEPVAFCPGYLRGLSFHNRFAVVGLSRQRQNRTLSGLPLDDALRQRNTEPRCGLQVIDTKSGDVVHWLHISGLVEELYDVVALPGVRRPMAIGLQNDQIRRVLNVGPEQSLNDAG